MHLLLASPRLLKYALRWIIINKRAENGIKQELNELKCLFCWWFWKSCITGGISLQTVTEKKLSFKCIPCCFACVTDKSIYSFLSFLCTVLLLPLTQTFLVCKSSYRFLVSDLLLNCYVFKTSYSSFSVFNNSTVFYRHSFIVCLLNLLWTSTLYLYCLCILSHAATM